MTRHATQPAITQPVIIDETSRRSHTDARLRKHADYQRVYQAARKQFSPSMSYFFAPRSSPAAAAEGSVRGPRIGITAGRVLGKAVERNRIKRRLREAIRHNLALLNDDVDVILHPRRTVLTIEFEKLNAEVRRIFISVAKAIAKRDASS